MHLHGLLSITIFLLCGFSGFRSINSEKLLNVLLVSPASRLTATHLDFHKLLANSIATNKSVGKVVLLGLNAPDGEKTEEARPGEKLSIWKRTIRSDPNGVEETWKKSAPLSNPWRKRTTFYLNGDEEATTTYLDVLLYNDQLMEELREQNFHIACWEGISLDGLQQVILHHLGIKHLCLTSSIPMSIMNWNQYGLQRIVNHVPGLNLARIGDHNKVKKFLKKETEINEITERNEFQITSYTKRAEKTYKLWQEKLSEKGENENRPELTDLAKNLPKLNQLFERSRWFIVNNHPMMDYLLVEEEVNALAARAHTTHLLPKLHFVGGLGMVGNQQSIKAGELDKETQAIFKKGPVVLVGFGSVIDLGIHTESSLHDAKTALENMQNAEVEKIEAAKKLVQTIEDNIARENALLEVLGKFQGKQHGFPHAQFILKYGPKEVKEYKNFDNYKNVHGIGWMAQKAILSQGAAKVPVFISHCGLNSVNETVHMGVPLICVPFFGDQLNNSEALASRGVAEVVDIYTYEKEKYQKEDISRNKNTDNPRELADSKFKEDLTKALQKFLPNSHNKYAQNMAKMQKRFNALHPVKNLHEDLEALHTEVFGNDGAKEQVNPMRKRNAGTNENAKNKREKV